MSAVWLYIGTYQCFTNTNDPKFCVHEKGCLFIPGCVCRTIWVCMALHFVPYPFTQSNILPACWAKFCSVSTYILYWKNNVIRTRMIKIINNSLTGSNKLYLMFMEINCRQFKLAIFTSNNSLWALFAFMKIPTFTFYCFFAKGAIDLYARRNIFNALKKLITQIRCSKHP